MISDPVERWQLRLTESTWEAYKPYWKKFVEINNIADPKQLLELSQQEASDLAMEFHAILKRQGYSSKSCSLGYSAIRSFYSHNGKPLERFLKKFVGKTQYEQGYLTTQKEVFRLVEAVPKWHNKFAVGICFQGGQRDGICSALKFRHIETRNWKEARVVVFDIPEFLPNKHGKNMNKWEVKYRFALLNDVIRYLVLHVQERERRGEIITPESWLLRSSHSNGERIEPITGDHVNQTVVDAAERIGIQRYIKTSRGRRKAVIHAHIGRVFFKTCLRQSNVDPESRDFMMGHKLANAGAYDKFIESEIVAAMEQARSRLALTSQPVSELERRKQTLLDSAALILSPEKLARLKQDLAFAKTEEQIDEVLDNFKNGREQLEYVRR